MIKIKLFAYFRDNRGKELDFEYKEGLKVIDVVSSLEIDPELVSIILINGKHHKLESKLADGDTLQLFPPVAGG